MTAPNIYQAIIPLLVPLLIMGLKLVWEKIPKWTIPLLVPILGGAADAVIAYVAGGTPNPIVGAILGSVGMNLREFIDQLKKASA